MTDYTSTAEAFAAKWDARTANSKDADTLAYLLGVLLRSVADHAAQVERDRLAQRFAEWCKP